MNTCYWCCKSVSEIKRCGNCRKRMYCSKECQVADWKDGHKLWCCKAGEINHDYEIKETTDGKGMGVFALRGFKQNEKIMADRCFLFPNYFGENPQALLAIFLPLQLKYIETMNMDSRDEEDMKSGKIKEDPVVVRIHNNQFEDSGGIKFLSLHGARANHACPGANNSHWNRDPKTNKMVFLATKDIAAGEEITFSYADRVSLDKGFTCRCAACTTPAILALREERDQIRVRTQDKSLPIKAQAATWLELVQSSHRLGFTPCEIGTHDIRNLFGVIAYDSAYVNLTSCCQRLMKSSEETMFGESTHPEMQELMYKHFAQFADKETVARLLARFPHDWSSSLLDEEGVLRERRTQVTQEA